MFLCVFVCVCVCVCVCMVVTHSGLSLDEKLAEVQTLIRPLLECVPHVFVTLGSHGVVWGSGGSGQSCLLRHFPVPKCFSYTSVVNVSGAGDRYIVYFIIIVCSYIM